VCIVSEAFVRRYLQGRSAIGTRIVVDLFAGPGEVEREIVGVARQIKGRADETEDLAQIYVPNDQDIWAEAYLLVRASAGSAESLMSPIRAAIARVDKDLPVRSVLTLDGVARQATERYRFRAVLAGTFGVLALVLAMAGIFGVLAYSVQQRTREFGVRVALGATAGSVLRMVFAGAARVVGVGALIGLALAALLTQTMTTFLFGVTALDPATFAGVLFLLAVTAALASAVPAIRASRVDPVEAFRAE
jgi:putative ABC transport system permease protein